MSKQLITSAQGFTNSWVDLGSAVSMNEGMAGARVAVWLEMTVGTSTNMRVRALAMLGISGTVEYSLPIKTVGASDVKVEAEYFEFNADASQNMVLEVVTNGLVPYVQFQIQDQADGTGTVASAHVTFSKLT